MASQEVWLDALGEDTGEPLSVPEGLHCRHLESVKQTQSVSQNSSYLAQQRACPNNTLMLHGTSSVRQGQGLTQAPIWESISVQESPESPAKAHLVFP